MDDPRWLDDREQHAWRSLQQMNRVLAGELERRLTRRTGLSSADYQVLAPLSETADGRMRAGELAVRAGWEKSRLSHQMRRMEQRGLIARENCASDARGAWVRLTAAGRAAIEAAAPHHVDDVRALLFDLLTPEEVEQLTTVADRVLDHLAGTPACLAAAAEVDSLSR